MLGLLPALLPVFVGGGDGEEVGINSVTHFCRYRAAIGADKGKKLFCAFEFYLKIEGEAFLRSG